MKRKNKIVITIVSLLGLYFILAVIPSDRLPDKKVFTGKTFRIAHRCGAKNFPENTLFACKKVIELGIADFLEMDVHLTKDKKLVVIHDEQVDRTTNGKGNVSELTLSEIQKLDAGYNLSPDGGKTFPFRGQGIIIKELEDFFKEIPDRKYYIEVKPESKEAAKSLVALVQKYKMEEKVVIGSFKQGVKDEIYRLLPDAGLFGTQSEITKWVVLQRLGLTGLMRFNSDTLAVPPHRSILNVSDSFMHSAKRQNIKVHVWTINEEEEMREMISVGVDGIMTDDPILLDRVLKNK